jgi:LmbE family N-acetylglucosaminyl deacetylase
MNVLAVGAHYDDIELGCAGTLIKHIQARDKVLMLVLTHSGYVDQYGKIMRTKELAKEEGSKAAGIIGAKVICAGLETKTLQYSDKLIEIIDRSIVENKIERVYTHWCGDVHADHYAVAKSSIAAARHVKDILMYRSNWYDSQATFKPQLYVDISDVFLKKMQAIKAHKNEVKKFGARWTLFVKNMNRNDGLRVGTRYAETFEVIRMVSDIRQGAR